MATERQRIIQNWIDSRQSVLETRLSALQKSVRHKCFLSFHHADDEEVISFISTFEDAIIPRVLGVSDEDEFIDSDDVEYVMDQIREKYLWDSTVTIVLVGRCTWARRYVDWEIYSTLRNDKRNRLSGLLAIELPSRGAGTLPPRVSDNIDGEHGYARYWTYPRSMVQLQSMTNVAFTNRTEKAGLINNLRDRKINNSPCS